jgi:hypothetical protein
MKQLLEAIQRGIAFEYLPEHVPNVTLEESPGEYFEQAVELHRWSFLGPPEQNRVQVSLVFRLDQPGFPEQATTRAYDVVASGGRMIVRRAK